MKLTKEQLQFKQTMLAYEDYTEEQFELDKNGDFAWIGTADHFYIWQLCSKVKQSEIDTLKAKAIPEGFVLVPMVPSQRMVDAVRKCYEGEAYLPYSLYSEFINQAMIESQEPSHD